MCSSSADKSTPFPLKSSSASLGRIPTIDASAVVRDSHIGKWTEVGPGWSILESTIGDYSYAAGSHGVIHYATVGKFCSFASHVIVNPGDHPMNRVSQHHFTYRRNKYTMGPDDAEVFDRRRSKSCRIGHDVWIGNGAKIMAGVCIGTGAVIGAGSVVTKDVPPYQVVAGVPARPIRFRFSDAVIEKLLGSQWWHWSHDTLQRRMDDMINIDRFLKRYC
jgi:phosphonate metabolism protein (transferase hexapeptide repeat family)